MRIPCPSPYPEETGGLFL